jgi:hypothetical protein
LREFVVPRVGPHDAFLMTAPREAGLAQMVKRLSHPSTARLIVDCDWRVTGSRRLSTVPLPFSHIVNELITETAQMGTRQNCQRY